MLSKTEIIEIHGKIIIDMMIIIDNSDKIANLLNIQTIVYNGINMLNHIFTMNVIHDIPKDILLHNCQTGSFCYLEYIEQACDKQIAQNMDFSAIYLFIYKQTMTFLNTSGSPHPPSTISNLLNLLQKNTQVLIFLNMNLHLKTLISMCDDYFIDFAKLFCKLNEADTYYMFLTIVFENMKAHSCSTNVYFVFLESVYSTISKFRPTKISNAQKENMMYLLMDEYDLHDDRHIKKMVKDFFTK
jgi:hypothetical protein